MTKLKRLLKDVTKMAVVIGWIIIVAGWLTNHWLSEIRDRRKEIRGQIDEIQEFVFELTENALAFHLNTDWQDEKANTVLFSIRALESQSLRLNLLSEAVIGNRIKRIRQAISLKNFERSTFKQQNYRSEITADIQAELEIFGAELESAYQRRYPNKFPYYRRVD